MFEHRHARVLDLKSRADELAGSGGALVKTIDGLRRDYPQLGDAGPVTGVGLPAVLAVRARFFLPFRWAVRTVQVLSADGGARTTQWRATAVAFMVLDLVVWSRLRKSEELALRTRTALDSADAAMWCLAPYSTSGQYEIAMFVAVPLAIETAVRRPWLSWLVPGTVFGGSTVARLLTGRSFAPWSLLLLGLAGVCGLVFRRYDTHLGRRAALDWERRREADDRRAYLAGLNSVAMGASSVVDGIEGLVPIIGMPAAGSALEEVAGGWKGYLCSVTRREGDRLGAGYLADVLNIWQREHNRHPDLASRVEFDLDEGTGTMMLTGGQIPALCGALDGLDLRRGARVAVADLAGPPTRPGESFSLVVGPHRVQVPADIRRAPRVSDPGPVAFVVMGILLIADAARMHVARLPAAGCLAVLFSSAAWSHRQVYRRGPRARPGVLVVAVAVAVATSAVMSLGAQVWTSPSGAATYPIIPQLTLLAILAGFYRRTVRPRYLWLAVVGAVLVVVDGAVLRRSPSSPRDLALALIWPGVALITATLLSTEFSLAAHGHGARLRAVDAAADASAFDEGRRVVIDLVSRARNDAYDQLLCVEATLAPALRDEAKSRLCDVDRRIRDLT